jgi:hypothetical protein
MSLHPTEWDAWIKALVGAGGLVLGAWRHGTRISGWFRRHWTERRTAAATRAKEQADAEKTVRVLNETINLLELHNTAWRQRYAEAIEDNKRKDTEIARQDRIISDLQKLLYGPRR